MRKNYTQILSSFLLLLLLSKIFPIEKVCVEFVGKFYSKSSKNKAKGE